MSLGRKARKMTCHTQYLKRKWKSLTRRSRTPSSCSSVFSCRRRKTFLTTSPAVVSVQGLESARRKYRCSAPLFGALKDKIKFIASDFDEPLADFAEYM